MSKGTDDAAPKARRDANLEDIYPLAPTQRGILFESLYTPENDIYLEQLSLRFEGIFDEVAFRRAVEEIVARHPCLRTAFAWDGMPEPVQIVRKRAEVPVITQDWRGLSPTEQELRLERFLEEDRARGMDLARPPLLRYALIQLDERTRHFVWTQHHILVDGWSVSLVFEEIFTTYEAHRLGKPITLPPVRHRFREYIAWLQRQDLVGAEAFWRRKLAGLSVTSPLSVDRAPGVRRAKQSSFGTVQVALSEEVTTKLQAVARAHQLTVSTFFVGAWGLLLDRYNGESEVLFGVTASGRPADLPGVAEMVGLFVNTLPARVRVRRDAPLVSWLKDVQQEQAESRLYEFSPLSEVQRWSEFPTGQRIFDSILVFENYPNSEKAPTDEQVMEIKFHRNIEGTGYPITVLAKPGPQLLLKIWFDESHFDQATAERMIGHLHRLIEGMALHPEHAVWQVPMLADVERRQVIDAFNAARIDYEPKCLHELVRAQAEATPDARALTFAEETLTYRELDRRANQVAHHLRALGVGPEVKVIIYLERSLEFVVTLLGILKAGGVCVPLDVVHPRGRIAIVVEDARPAVVVTTVALRDALPPHGAAVVLMDADRARIAAQPDGPPSSGVAPGNLAYIIYTSGSTGRPKGVMLPHTGLVSLFFAMREWKGFGRKDLFFAITTFTFDVGIADVFYPLTSGGALYLASREEMTDGALIRDGIKRTGATAMHATPTAWRMLFDAGWEGGDLTTGVNVGEALPRELANRLGPKVDLHNCYGPTETSIFASDAVIEAGEGAISVGGPVKNDEFYVLDDELQPVPIGVPGECYIAGEGLARGYVNRPDLTAERFLPNPFAKQPGQRMYLTGDLVRWRTSGELEVLGRRDHQVKLRGFRIELGEIETVLEQHASVRKSLVVLREEASGDKRLVAYVVPKGADVRDQDLGEEHFEHWRAAWAEIMARTDEFPATFNTTGWISSFTGTAIPDEQMREWVERTVERIRAQRPTRVLEIGCGSGLLLFQIAPTCETYWGVDFSAGALASIERDLARLPQVQLHRRAADEIADLGDRFDGVVVNSVIQYFPSIDYLIKVIDQAVAAIAPDAANGFVFIGDVRNLPLLAAFHATAQLAKASPSDKRTQLRDRVRKAAWLDEELVVDPSFFHALRARFPRITRVSVQLKRGQHHNEMSQFRYDVVLHLGAAGALPAPSDASREFGAGTTVASVRAELVERAPTVLELRDVPNARVATSTALVRLLEGDGGGAETVAELRAALPGLVGAPIEPESFFALGDELPYDVEVSYAASGAADRFDVVLRRRDAVAPSVPASARPAAPPAPSSWAVYANTPLARNAAGKLVPRLREHLAEVLPPYMVPAAFVVLERIPVLPNGKTDRANLPAPDGVRPELEHPYLAPRTSVESVLARIWGEVLQAEMIGVHDDFFERGGDSIYTIQVVSRAKQAGLKFTPHQLFQNPTIAELAQVVGVTEGIVADQGEVVGPAPITPSQRWLLDEVGEGRPRAQTAVLRSRRGVDGDVLVRALRRLVAHHDGLRLRLHHDSTGWRQLVAPDDTPVPLEHVDLTAVPDAELDRALRQATDALAATLDLQRGPLVAVALFALGGERGQRVGLAVHDLVVDDASWAILLEDLDRAYDQIARGQPALLPPKTSSFQLWATRLEAQGRALVTPAEVSYWSARAEAPGSTPATDGLQEASISLSPEETRTLLDEVPKAYRTGLEDVLLAALARTLRPGGGGLVVHRQARGRASLFRDVDVKRTVGHLEVIHPVRLTEVNAAPGLLLRAVKEELASVPLGGVGHGLLAAEAPARAAVLFRDRASLEAARAESALFEVVPDPDRVRGGRLAAASTPLEVTATFVDGRLRVHFSLAVARGADAHAARRLAATYEAALRGLITHCLSDEAGGSSPSDFPLAGLDQAALDALLGRDRGIADVYPLSPMQQGLLFECLYAPVSVIYFQQMTFRIEGDLDVGAFRAAWRELVSRHEIFRTRFAWDDLPRPLQIVEREVDLPFEVEDWRAAPPAEQRERLLRLIELDNARGFDLRRAPLMRGHLVELGSGVFEFVWSHHHLLLDGWSLPLVFRELLAIYGALCKGKRPPTVTRRPYRDFIAWLEAQDLARAQAFWKQQLAGFVAATPTGLDGQSVRNRGGEMGHGKAQLLLSPGETLALQQFCRGQQLTLNTLVLGAWAVLLARCGGEDDVVFGTTVAGRPADLPGIDTMVGLFINTVPLRVAVSEHVPIGAWLKRIQAQQSEIREYDYSPLSAVQRWSDMPRGGGLFETIVIFENQPVDDTLRDLASDLEIRAGVKEDVANYPLTLIATPRATELTFELFFDGHRFERATMDRLLGHLRQLLAGMAAAGAEGHLAPISLLTERERRHLLVEWNLTQTPLPEEELAHQLVEAQARRTPDALAVVGPDGTLTYRELDVAANRLAHALVRRGVGPDTVVALLAERGLALLTAILAVHKAGGAYLPLDPKHPPARTGQILAQSRAPLVVVARALAPGLASATEQLGSSVTTCLLEDLTAEGAVGAASAAPVVSRTTGKHLAYVIYTSGSTGLPKGAMVEHRGMVNHLVAKVNDLRLVATDRVAQTASQCFDISVWQFFAALIVGGQTRIYEDAVANDPGPLLDALERDAITIVETVPSLLRLVLAETEDRARARLTLRWMIPTGEALPPELARSWLARFPGVPLLNAYGPTECSDDVTHHALAVAPPEGEIHMPIGRPVANMRMYVLDRRAEPVPEGVAGELFVGGVGVGRGYLHDPVRTAQAFVPDPFAGEPGARLYRTGDLVRYRSDGNLEFHGRVDHQVKIRGNRIELGEIEVVVGALAGVDEVVVVARVDGGTDARLVAYFTVKAEGAAPTIDVLRAHVKERLPDYMVPSAFVPLDALPLTPNGKLDRRALPAPEPVAEPTADYVAPRTEVERVLARIWMTLLRIPRVGVTDNFFALGGDSILSIQMGSRARAAGVKVTPKQIFTYPTLGELAAVAGTATVDAVQGPVVGEVALTPIQHAFFVTDPAEPHHFNQAGVLEVRVAVEADQLATVLTALTAHHDVLRVRFERDGTSGWRQRIVPPEDRVTVTQVDLTGLEPAEQERRFTAEAERLQASMDLARGPVLRAALGVVGDGRRPLLFLAIHHLAVDLVSWQVLLEDLETGLRAVAAGRPIELPPKTSSVLAWADRLVKDAGSRARLAELDFWLTPAAARLPLDGPGGPNTIASGQLVKVALDRTEVAAFEESALAHRAQVHELLLTAAVKAFAGWTGHRSLDVAMEGHGREPLFDDIDLSRTVGWFASLYPLRLSLADVGSTPAVEINAIKAQVRRVPGNGIGFGILRYLGDAEVQRGLAALPEPDVAFNYFGKNELVPRSGAFEPSPTSAGSPESPLALRPAAIELNVAYSADKLEVVFVYSDRLHRRSTIESLAAAFLVAVRELTAGGRSADAGMLTPSDFPLAELDQAELESLLGEVSPKSGEPG